MQSVKRRHLKRRSQCGLKDLLHRSVPMRGMVGLEPTSRPPPVGPATWISWQRLVHAAASLRGEFQISIRIPTGHRLRRRPALPFIRREVGAIRMVEDDGAYFTADEG